MKMSVCGWEADDPSQTKIFSLAGFNSAPNEKADLVAKITSLGGSVVEGSCWSGECSHVVAANFGHYLEKVMAGLVSGRWVVTKRFVDRSYQKGRWANTKAFVCDEVVLAHRRRWFEEGGIFKNMKVVLLLDNAVKRGVYNRIISAGGGEVHTDWSLSDLLVCQPGSSDLSCVVVDPGIQLASDPRHKQWVRWLEVVKDTWPGDCSLHHVYYKYIFSIITQCKILPAEQFTIFSPSVLEMAKRDGNMPQTKRSAPNNDSCSQAATKKGKVDGQSTKIVTTVFESNIVTIDDSDDDIEVLEQKITQRKAGFRRTYYEKPKSVRRKLTALDNAEVFDLDDSESDEELTSKNTTNGKQLLEVSMEIDQDARDDHSEGEEFVQNKVDKVKPVEIVRDESNRKSSDPEVCGVPGSKEGGGISVGLQHAISALQQTSRGPVKLSRRKADCGKKDSSVSKVNPTAATSAEDTSSDDDIEIISSKAGIKVKKSRRAAPKLDTRAKMFQSRLKDLLEAEKSENQAETEETLVDPPDRSPSPEIPKVTIAEEVPLPSEPVATFEAGSSEKSNELFHKVLSCILERQTFTDECIAVSNTNCRTARFDKHKEAGRLGEVKVRPVDSTVKEEFYQKYLEKTGQKEAEISAVGLSGEINQISNCVSSLRYLRCSTSFTVHPTPAILNSLMVDYILEQSSPMVRISAFSYLSQFLFLHLGRESGLQPGQVHDRPAWLSLILSACRTGSNMQWDSFSVESKQDIAQCWRFFCGVLQQHQASCKDEVYDSQGQSGPMLLLQLLVKVMHKDLEIWWKHFRRTDGKDGRELSFPLLYYMLDGSTNLTSNMTKTVVRLYHTVLVNDQDRTVVRHLVSMCGLLLAHLDCQIRQSFWLSGAKLELAASLQSALSQCQPVKQGRNWLLTELSLLQPPWLAMMVARQCIIKKSHSQVKLNSVSSLISKMSQLTVSSCPELTAAADCLAHRMISSCHLHTLLRTHWLHKCNIQHLGSSWKMMDRMDKVGVRSQASSNVVRFRSGLTHKISTLVEDLNTIASYVNGQKAAGEDDGAISFLLFKMTSPTSF